MIRRKPSGRRRHERKTVKFDVCEIPWRVALGGRVSIEEWQPEFGSATALNPDLHLLQGAEMLSPMGFNLQQCPELGNHIWPKFQCRHWAVEVRFHLSRNHVKCSISGGTDDPSDQINKFNFSKPEVLPQGHLTGNIRSRSCFQSGIFS
jgi:hypothetical protein